MEQEGILLEEEKEFKRFYKLSLWWVNHRATLQRIGIGLFIAFDAALLSFVAWTMLDSFAISYDAEQQAVAQMVAFGQQDLRAYTIANAADDLSIADERVFAIGDGRYDLYAEVVNSNDDWWAEFEYYFRTDEGDTDLQQGFILPSENKPVVQLAYASDVPVSSAQLVIADVDWNRLDHHAISDYQVWESDRLNFEIEGAAFTKETDFEDEVFGRTAFTVTNETAFSYYQPKFFIVLYRGSSVSGINRTTLGEIDSREEVDVSVNWFGTLPSVSKVEVVPEINIFDVEVYKPLAGESTRDTRTRAIGR